MSNVEELLGVSKEEVERGLELHKKSIVCDSLYTMYPDLFTERMVNATNELLDAGKSFQAVYQELMQLYVKELTGNLKARYEYVNLWWKKSGVTCISLTVDDNDILSSLTNISRTNLIIDNFRDSLMHATRADDIRRAKKERKHAILYNFQNTIPLGGGVDWERELDHLDLFYGLGVRIIQLTYNLRNFVGDGCTERYESGLSHFGAAVVERMNDLGILVDTGHCGYQTTLDAVEASNTPVIASHTGCRGVYDYPRSKTDEELQVIAEKGGYVGIYAYDHFLAKEGGTITDFLDHINYAVNLIGVDHIGIGTDAFIHPKMPERLLEEMDQDEPRWNGFWVHDWLEASALAVALIEARVGSLAWTNWPYFTVGLVSRGYSDQEIQKIIGENFLRVLEKVVG
jgi:membrane dipeptidase